MALVELHPREIDKTVQTMSAVRKFHCTWDEREHVEPRIGDQHPDNESLFVERVNEKQFWGRPEGAVKPMLMCELTVYYSTRTPYHPIRTTSINVELLETTGFRHWRFAGTTSTSRMAIPYALIDHTYETVTWFDPRGIIFNLANTVNSMPWDGFARGCVLYMGADVRDEFTNLGEHAWRAKHRFMIRLFDWNMQWREGRQKRDYFGNLLYNTTTGEPIMVGGTAGTSGWDYLDPVLYEYKNFMPLLLVR